MKKKGYIIIANLVLSLIIILATCFHFFKRRESLPLIEISFPQYAGEINKDIEFIVNIDTKCDIKNQSILNEFYITDNQNFEKNIDTIATYYNVDKNQTTTEDVTIRGNNKKNITQYGNTSFKYTNNALTKKEVTLSDSYCISIASEELKKIDIYSDDLECYGVGYDIQTDLQTGEETIIAKTVYFERKIDNIPIEGNSKISISIINEGKISSIYCGYSEICDTYNVNKSNILTIEKALESCKNLNGYIELPDNTDTVLINNIECVYWEDSAPNSRNNTIQPVYKITGQAYCNGKYCGEFVAIESALKK